MGKKIRVKSKFYGLPKEMQDLVNEMLEDVNYTYQNIADEMTERGYELSRSSVGRYAISRYKDSQALKIRLELVKAQAKIAADASKDGNTLDYAEALLGIVSREMMNRLMSASPEEYDEVSITDIMKSVSRLARDLNNIDKLKFQKDKGISEITRDLENTLDKYIDDKPELKAALMEKLTAELDKVQNRR